MWQSPLKIDFPLEDLTDFRKELLRIAELRRTSLPDGASDLENHFPFHTEVDGNNIKISFGVDLKAYQVTLNAESGNVIQVQQAKKLKSQDYLLTSDQYSPVKRPADQKAIVTLVDSAIKEFYVFKNILDLLPEIIRSQEDPPYVVLRAARTSLQGTLKLSQNGDAIDFEITQPKPWSGTIEPERFVIFANFSGKQQVTEDDRGKFIKDLILESLNYLGDPHHREPDV